MQLLQDVFTPTRLFPLSTARAEVSELHKGCKSPSFPSPGRKTTTKKTSPNTQTRSWWCFYPRWCWNNWSLQCKQPLIFPNSVNIPHIHNFRHLSTILFFFLNHIKDQGLKSCFAESWNHRVVEVGKDLKNYLIPPQEALSSGPGCSKSKLPWTFPGILFWARFLWVFVWFRQTQQMPGWNTSPDGRGKWKKKGKGKKKKVLKKRGSVWIWWFLWFFSSPQQLPHVPHVKSKPEGSWKRKLLIWAGWEQQNPTISCLWCDKPRLWHLQEHQHHLPPRAPSPPTRTCELFPAKSDGSRWQKSKINHHLFYNYIKK